jgi:phosphosulfolactate phosphohydrolase-like enzyme
MRPAYPLLVCSALLFSGALVNIAIGHQAFLDGCVCIVNAILRSMIALGAALICGAIAAILPERSVVVGRALTVIQSILLLVGTFFLIQHAFFLLEAA